MALTKTVLLQFEGATWRDLRAFVAAGDAADIPDAAELLVAWDGDGENELPSIAGIEFHASEG